MTTNNSNLIDPNQDNSVFVEAEIVIEDSNKVAEVQFSASVLKPDVSNKVLNQSYHVLKDLVQQARKSFMRIAEILYYYSSNRLWQRLGYSSLNDLLREQDISISPSLSSKLIHIYQRFVVSHEVSIDHIEDIEYNKLAIISPKVTDDNIEELIECARTLTIPDLRSFVETLVDPEETVQATDEPIQTESFFLISGSSREKPGATDNSVEYVVRVTVGERDTSTMTIIGQNSQVFVADRMIMDNHTGNIEFSFVDRNIFRTNENTDLDSEEV